MTGYGMILSLLLAGMGTAATAQNTNLPISQTKSAADLLPLCLSLRKPNLWVL